MSYQSSLPYTSVRDEREVVEEQQQGGVSLTKYVMVFSVFAASALLVASTQGGLFPSTSVKTNRIQLASEGAIFYSSLSDTEKSELFDEFKATWGREYLNDEEEEERFTNFKATLVAIDERNEAESSAGGTARHGVTKFSDFSSDEFAAKLLGFKANSEVTATHKVNIAEYTGTDTYQNWAESGYTTPVKDQVKTLIESEILRNASIGNLLYFFTRCTHTAHLTFITPRITL